MKIKLYTNVYEDAHEEKLSFIELTIRGKLVHNFVLPASRDEEMDGVYQDCLRQFSYQNDDTYKSIFPRLKLNTKVKIFHSSIHDLEDSNGFVYQDGSIIGGKEGYCYLNFIQRLFLDFSFKKLWIQKEKNLKWIISSLIAIAGVAIIIL